MERRALAGDDAVGGAAHGLVDARAHVGSHGVARGERVERHAADADVGPREHLRVPVLAEHVRVHRLRRDAEVVAE